MGELVVGGFSVITTLRSLRWASMLLGLSNTGLILIGGFLMLSVSPSCTGSKKFSLGLVLVISCVRIGCMAVAAKAQLDTATTIVNHSMERVAEDNVSNSRFLRQRRYRRWLWWTRFGMLVNIMQLLMTFYLMYTIVRGLYMQGADSLTCLLGHEMKDIGWTQFLMVSFLALLCFVTIIQCFTGSDVLRWRSFYATHDSAWRAHYSEVFDHGIREALCCLGRAKYLSVLEEDDVYSVARLLSDLVAYRATGRGHLELLAGLTLMQSHRKSPKACNKFIKTPNTRLQEAIFLHRFAEAAYTGPLLDFGRNPLLFPFLWLYRQGVLNPWSSNRRPILDGDNWWRGHAAAFLKCVNLPQESLRLGRVCQKKRELAYFIVVLHDIETVVIAIRGTETPEDLITNGICRECNLSENDLDGLINGQLFSNDRETILSSYLRYGHSGIVESARELYMQVDTWPGEVTTSETTGFLSSLLGPGCECNGYKLRIVGHSLGGSVASLLGLRLKGRYPNLHVFAYGPLPCVDLVTAEACSDFVTAIVCNDEFSSRLSVNSIFRLRAASIKVLSDESLAKSTIISKLARKFLNWRQHPENGENHRSPSLSIDGFPDLLDCHVYPCGHLKHAQVGPFLYEFTCAGTSNNHQCSSFVTTDLTSASQCSQLEPRKTPKQAQYIENSPFDDPYSNYLKSRAYDYNIELPDCYFSDHKADNSDNFYPTCVSRVQATPIVEASQSTEVIGESKEVFLAGSVIHLVPQRTNILPIWKFFMVNEGGYTAYMASREEFKDINVSPYMFLDHLPWRCRYAMQSALETHKSEARHGDLFNQEDVV